MGKMDELQRLAGHMDASLGVGVDRGMSPPVMTPGQTQRVPARLQGVTKARDALLIPTDKIQRDDGQPREDFEETALERLAESLRTRGQLQPIRVRWDEGRGAYVLVMGERRWRAATMAGIPTMSCIVHDGLVEPDELLALQLVENALREDLKPVEQAKAYRRLMDAHGWSGNQLARELSVDQAAVSRTLALLNLPAAVQALVEAGDLAPRTAYEISKLPDSEAQVEMADQAVAGGITRDQVQATVKARKLGKSKAEPGAKREYKYPDGARVTVTLPPGMAGTAAYLEMLRRAVKDTQAEAKVAARQAEGQGEAA
jgi:ParB family transcriptional regulator, chromosome partitioning protein